VNGDHESVAQFNYLVREHAHDGVRESLKIIPVADGREYEPELAPLLARRTGRARTCSLGLAEEAKQVADGVVMMALMQRLGSDQNVPCEYQLDAVALVPGQKERGKPMSGEGLGGDSRLTARNEQPRGR
jgi:hypothetical protein